MFTTVVCFHYCDPYVFITIAIIILSAVVPSICSMALVMFVTLVIVWIMSINISIIMTITHRSHSYYDAEGCRIENTMYVHIS